MSNSLAYGSIAILSEGIVRELRRSSHYDVHVCMGTGGHAMSTGGAGGALVPAWPLDPLHLQALVAA